MQKAGTTETEGHRGPQGTTPRASDFGIPTARPVPFDAFCTPLLEILPRLRRAIIATRECMCVDGCGHLWIRVPQPFADIRQRHARGQQVRSVAMSKRVEAGTLGQLESPTEQRNSRRHRVRLQRRTIRVTENQVPQVSISEMLPIWHLRFTLRFQRAHR